MNIPIESIDTTPAEGVRQIIRQDVIDEYAALDAKGVDFPAVVLFGPDEAGKIYLGGGLHRLKAFKQNGRKELTPKRFELRDGGEREARLFAAGDNHDHGLRRSNEDRRKAVAGLLKDPEWSKKSDNWIAEKCKVSGHLVADVRALIEKTANTKPSARTGKDGRSRPAKKKAKAAQGTPKFDFAVAFGEIGRTARLADNLAAVYPDEKESAEFQGFGRLMEELLTLWKDWQKKLTKGK